MAGAAPEVQWAMNFCACQIGVHEPEFRSRCIRIGEALGLYKDEKVAKDLEDAFASASEREAARARRNRNIAIALSLAALTTAVIVLLFLLAWFFFFRG